MSALLEERAEAACRDVGHATMLVGVLPGMGALTGLVFMPLLEPSKPMQWGVSFGFLALAVALVSLGLALKRRRPWSFRAAQATFVLVAIVGAAALIVSEDSSKVGVAMCVVVPLLFVGGAEKARAAVDEAERARAVAPGR